MKPLLRTLSAATTAITLLSLSTTASHADRWWGPDRSGDVRQYAFSPEPPPCGTVEERTAPQDASTDLVGLSVRHEGDSVEVRAHFRNLTGWDDRWLDLALKTDQREFVVNMTRDPARYAGGPALWDASEPPSAVDECGSFSILLGGVPCEGLTMSRSSRRDYASVVVPRSCLGSPRWVRAGADNQRSVNGRFRSDSWGTATADPGDAPSVLGTLGPRVRHSG